MKIVQSLWTKPTFKNRNFNNSDRNKGGWSERKYNYMSWALSCLQFRQFYEEVELVTDKQGYHLLINQLQLPYTNVKVVLDDLQGYHPDLWALGKLYAYQIQDTPFIHADGDVYIWSRLRESFEQAALVAQNIESGYMFYDTIFKELNTSFDYIPRQLFTSIAANGKIIAVNAGLLGGSDLGFVKEYAKTGIEFINRNLDCIEKVDVGSFNTIFEQFLFHAMAEQSGRQIEFLLQNVNENFDGLAELTGTSGKTKYVHTIAGYKKAPYIGELVAFRLQQEHPDHFYHIKKLLQSAEI